MVEPRRIEVGTREMVEAWLGGVENYIPTLGGHELEEEGGVTVVSLRNLRDVRKTINKRVMQMWIGSKQGVLVRFEGFETYLATGFSIGYSGEGPTGLATFAAESGFGDVHALRSYIAILSQNYRGKLFPIMGKQEQPVKA